MSMQVPTGGRLNVGKYQEAQPSEDFLLMNVPNNLDVNMDGVGKLYVGKSHKVSEI